MKYYNKWPDNKIFFIRIINFTEVSLARFILKCLGIDSDCSLESSPFMWLVDYGGYFDERKVVPTFTSFCSFTRRIKSSRRKFNVFFYEAKYRTRYFKTLYELVINWNICSYTFLCLNGDKERCIWVTEQHIQGWPVKPATAIDPTVSKRSVRSSLWSLFDMTPTKIQGLCFSTPRQQVEKIKPNRSRKGRDCESIPACGYTFSSYEWDRSNDTNKNSCIIHHRNGALEHFIERSFPRNVS